jgi:hypothetical protein
MLFDMTANSNSVRKLMVLDPEYPKDVTVSVIRGQTTSATFEAVIAEHGKPAEYTYQWYIDGEAVDGATEFIFTKDDLTETKSYAVYCKITNAKGTVTTRIATLDVVQHFMPVLDERYPQDGIAEAGAAFTSNVVIAEPGNPAPTYQWYKNGVAVTGATSDTYTFTPEDVGSFTLYCEVTNDAGKVTSRTAKFTTRLYLYKAGNECTAKTGGWTSSNLIYDNSDGVYQIASEPTKNPTSMDFVASSTEVGSFNGSYTANKIGLSTCKTLKAEVTVNYLDKKGNSNWAIRALTGMNFHNATAAVAGAPNSTGAKTVELDVSWLPSSYYIAMMMGFTSERSSKSHVTVHNVWLE